MRWIAIFATLIVVGSVFVAAAGDITLAIYGAVLAVFLLVAEMSARG